MASTSSSTSNSQYCPRWKYDAFLNFRGEDTRKTITGYLYKYLTDRGIITFQDDKRLEHGDSIPEELLKAIEESQVALIVFSKNYATSRWCLNELVKIMECKDEYGQIVIPIFYDVDPSHVRYQRESFAKAFAKHESKYNDGVEGMQKVQEWKTALTDAANLKGCDTRDMIESECIWDLVDQISSKLCKTSLSYLQNIVGIDSHLKEVNSLLEMEMNDVRIIGIWGICFSKEAMKNMKMLRILYIWYGDFNDCFPCHDGSIEYLPKNLCWFIWNHLGISARNFEPKRLVHLYLRSSSLRHLWKGTKGGRQKMKQLKMQHSVRQWRKLKYKCKLGEEDGTLRTKVVTLPVKGTCSLR